MKLKARLLIPALAVAALLLIATVGVVAAQTATTTPTPAATPTPTQPSPRDQVLGRAAQILGVDESKLQGALEQATTETVRPLRDQALKARLDRLVADGRLTQADADATYTWFQSRPDAAVGIVGGFMGHGGRGCHGGLGMERHGRHGVSAQQPGGSAPTQTPTAF